MEVGRALNVGACTLTQNALMPHMASCNLVKTLPPIPCPRLYHHDACSPPHTLLPPNATHLVQALRDDKQGTLGPEVVEQLGRNLDTAFGRTLRRGQGDGSDVCVPVLSPPHARDRVLSLLSDYQSTPHAGP